MMKKLLLLLPLIALLGFFGSTYEATASTVIKSPYTTSHTGSRTVKETYKEKRACVYDCSTIRYKCKTSTNISRPWWDTKGSAPSDCSPYAKICRSSNCNHTYCSNIPTPRPYIWVTKTRNVKEYFQYNRCHYISKVNQWSNTCVNNARVATNVTWSTVNGSSCRNVPLTQYCYNGKCGGIANQTFNTWPSTDGDTCAAGDTETVSKTAGSWKWKCLGFNKGTTASCEATTGDGQGADDPGFRNN